MRSGRLLASSASHTGRKAERNREAMRDREAVRNQRKLVTSGRTKRFASGRWSGRSRGMYRINVDIAIGRLNETVNHTAIDIALEKREV